MRDWIAVAAGGAIGSLARWLLAGAVQAKAAAWAAPGTPLPLGTLAVNVIGSAFVAALVAGGIAAERFAGWRLFLVTGVAGGFTTWSAFNQETVELLRAGMAPRAALYVALSLAGGLAGAAGGVALARLFRG